MSVMTGRTRCRACAAALPADAAWCSQCYADLRPVVAVPDVAGRDVAVPDVAVPEAVGPEAVGSAVGSAVVGPEVVGPAVVGPVPRPEAPAGWEQGALEAALRSPSPVRTPSWLAHPALRVAVGTAGGLVLAVALLAVIAGFGLLLG